MRSWLGIAILSAGAVALASGCSMYRNDRCWMDKEQYLIARDLYVTTGSLDLVQKELEDYEWSRCKINESLYRLEKEFEVLPEAALGSASPGAEAPAPAPTPLSVPPPPVATQ